MSDGKLRVDISRKRVFKQVIHGAEFEIDAGNNYVDVYFPDGTQRTCGYIARDDKTAQFVPCHNHPQVLVNAIQEEINKLQGWTGTEGPQPLEVVEYVGNEPEEDEDEE